MKSYTDGKISVSTNVCNLWWETIERDDVDER